MGKFLAIPCGSLEQEMKSEADHGAKHWMSWNPGSLVVSPYSEFHELSSGKCPPARTLKWVSRDRRFGFSFGPQI